MSGLPGPPLWRLPTLGARAIRRPHEVALTLFRSYGPVVRLSLSPYVYLFGREANEMILSTQAEDFTWREALISLEPIDGPTALVLSDGEVHKRRRRLVQPAFATRRIDAAVPIIVEEVDRIIDALEVAETLDIYQAYRGVVRRIVTRVLFGSALAGQADRLGEVLEPAIRFVDRPPQFQFPGSPGRRPARRARHEADRIVDAELARRRRSNDYGEDVLGVLLASDLTDAEARDQVVSLIAAGYDTTSAAVAWTVLEVLRHPEVCARTRQEIRDRLGDSRAPGPDDLRAMPYLTAVVNEALRLWPPGALSGRRAGRPVEYAGHVIPEGSIVLYSAYVTHRDPSLWGEDADRFRPERWFNNELPPYSFVPFGGSYRRCIGFALALAEVQVTLTRLLQRAGLRLTDPHRTVRGVGLSALRPDGGVGVTVETLR